MIRRFHSRLPSLKQIQTRAQSSAAVSRRSSRQFQSTIHHSESHDFSSLALRRDGGDYYFEEHTDAIISAFNTYAEKQSEVVVESQEQPRVTALACNMDLVEAAYAARDYESYDKILILMRHGEAEHNKFQHQFVQKKGILVTDSSSVEESYMDEDHPVDPMLTGRGCGQMMGLSRRTATFFNAETGLKPDLFVVSPLRRAIQSAMIAFPTYTSFASLENIPWIAYPHLMERANGHKSEFVSSPEVLEELFPGVNFDMMKSLVGNDVDGFNNEKRVPMFENKLDLLGRTDDFLRWIKERDERVIVVSSHATWLHSLCEFSLRYEQEERREMFKKGEMLPVGIKFD